MLPFFVMIRFLLFFFTCSSLTAGEYLVFVHPGGNRGFFNVMDILFGNIARYDPDKYDGACIDLKKKGYNYDPELGPNYWNYYFEPFSIGEEKEDSTVREVINLGCQYYYWYLEDKMDRNDVKCLIDQYLVVLPHILDKLKPYEDRFAETDHVLAVHYRGTDRMAQHKHKTSHKQMIDKVKSVLKQWKENTLIYVATDERNFLNEMIKEFPGKVVFQKGAQRSTNNKSFHQRPLSPYDSGEEALIDCILLSKADYLIRTESCLSRWSGYFNPDLPIYNMTKGRNE